MKLSEIAKLDKTVKAFNADSIDAVNNQAEYWDKHLKPHQIAAIFKSLPEYDEEAFGLVMDDCDIQVELEEALYDVLYKAAEYKLAMQQESGKNHVEAA